MPAAEASVETGSGPQILVGMIGRPHGVRGQVRVTSYTADPAALTHYGPLSDDRGRTWRLGPVGDGIMTLAAVQADGRQTLVRDRQTAAALTNTRLFIARTVLPPPPTDEFYCADLIGLRAVDGSGAALGTVIAVHDYGAGSSIEIASASHGPPLLVAFTRATVPEIDLPKGCLVVQPPAEVVLDEQATA